MELWEVMGDFQVAGHLGCLWVCLGGSSSTRQAAGVDFTRMVGVDAPTAPG